jgi:hypothetical protein
MPLYVQLKVRYSKGKYFVHPSDEPFASRRWPASQPCFLPNWSPTFLSLNKVTYFPSLLSHWKNACSGMECRVARWCILKPKNPKLGKLWSTLQWKMLLFSIFPVFVWCTKKNLATLMEWRFFYYIPTCINNAWNKEQWHDSTFIQTATYFSIHICQRPINLLSYLK